MDNLENIIFELKIIKYLLVVVVVVLGSLLIISVEGIPEIIGILKSMEH